MALRSEYPPPNPREGYPSFLLPPATRTYPPPPIITHQRWTSIPYPSPIPAGPAIFTRPPPPSTPMTTVSLPTSSISPKTFPQPSPSPQLSLPPRIRLTPRPSRSSPSSQGLSTTYNSPTSSQTAVAVGTFTSLAHTNRSCWPVVFS